VNWHFVLTIIYALFMFWTGLQRSIEAQAFKPNAFYFCLFVGVLSIIGAFLFRASRRWFGVGVTTLATGIALAFYVYCFVTQPEKDATIRVALAIVASIAEVCVVASAIFQTPVRVKSSSDV
jgi:uncharacterized membrane protein HdeD (DUF308 family)